MTKKAEVPSEKPLAGKVAVVTGASRGVGKGIAWELGIAGATVYVTGRSVRGKPTTDGLPGTVHATARLVTEAGGEGVAVVCDHTRDEDVAALAETVGAGHGRLDLLVNNVWGGYEDYDPKLFTLPFWEQPLWRWDRMFDTGVRGHYTATRALAPLMLGKKGKRKGKTGGKGPRGLIVSTSSGDSGRFMDDLQYDLAKAAVERLVFGLAKKLWKERVAAVAIQPGFTRTEAVLAKASPEQLPETHSPRYVGRAVVALATDPELLRLSGGVYKAGDLGRHYGFRDVDGTRPEPFRMPEGFDKPRLPVEDGWPLG
jgi:NAD(P)-dependent dehydrogenase (short-subunit alcohol dehydrogenase family)